MQRNGVTETENGSRVEQLTTMRVTDWTTSSNHDGFLSPLDLLDVVGLGISLVPVLSNFWFSVSWCDIYRAV